MLRAQLLGGHLLGGQGNPADLADHGGQGGDRSDLGRVNLGQDRQGHARIGRLFRVLDQDQPATLRDGDGPSHAVVQGAREDRADDPGTVRLGGAAEQHIDRRPVTVLPGTSGGDDPTPPDDEVLVGRRDQDPPGSQRGRGPGERDREGACPGQDGGQRAGPARRQVQHDEHRGREVDRQGPDQGGEALDPTRRRPDDDQVAMARISRGRVGLRHQTHGCLIVAGS